MGENKFLSIVEWTNKMWHSHMMANKKKRWISKSLCWAKGTNIKESVMYDSIYIQSFKCTLIYYDKKQISGCLGQPNSCPTGTASSTWSAKAGSTWICAWPPSTGPVPSCAARSQRWWRGSGPPHQERLDGPTPLGPLSRQQWRRQLTFLNNNNNKR